MKAEICGIPLQEFEAPIGHALPAYEEITDGKITFDDVQGAQKLALRPDKPNTARSKTTFRHMGEVTGTLIVIAFAPGDGTGDEKTSYRLEDLDTSKFSGAVDSGIVPRTKKGTHSEAHLTIATKVIDRPNRDVDMFAGNLDVIGIRGESELIKIAEVGQKARYFSRIFRSTVEERGSVSPAATLTVGHKGAIDSDDIWGERFGDPHAIYNPWEEYVQICGFVAIANDNAENYLKVLKLLQVVEPRA